MSRSDGLRAPDWPSLKAPNREALLEVLRDLRWHPAAELMRIGGNRYGGRLQELRDEGYQIESEPLPDRAQGKRYRLLPIKAAPRRPRVKVYLEEGDARALLGGEVTLFARQSVAEALRSYSAGKKRRRGS